MKKRLVKKKEKRIRKDVHKILDLVLDINGLEDRKRSITGNKPTAFLYFYGHVSSVIVNVHEHGWDPGTDYNFRKECYLQNNAGNEYDISNFLISLTEEKKKLCRN